MNEDRIQSDCYTWFHNSFPELRGLLCYNLNNSRNKVRAMMDKAMGLQKGRSDMVFYWKGTATMLELKTEEGYQSKEQKEWQSRIEKAGFQYYVIRSLEEFQQLINKIIQSNSLDVKP